MRLMIISGSGGMGIGEGAPICADQIALTRIPGLIFELKLLTQGYANDTPTPTRDMAKLIARRGADLLAAYFKVVATASNGRNALVDQNHHLAWVPALRSLVKEKRWAEFPDVKNHHVQAVMIAIGDARKRFIDELTVIPAPPDCEHYKTFHDLVDRFNIDRIGQTGSSSSFPAIPAAPVAPAQSAVPSAFQISANHLQSTADQMIRDAFAALQNSDQQSDQISNGLQTSADQLQAAVTKTIQDALDAFNANDKVIETITQQTDQANKAAQMAQTDIMALRAKYETAQKQSEKMKDEHDKMKDEHDKMKDERDKMKDERDKTKDENQKVKDQNVEAAAAAVANALGQTITGAVTHAMAEIEAAEHRGSISGQEMLFAHIFDELNELEALRGGDDVEWTADDLDDYKDKHDIPDF
ncbi:hypothetical protein HER10_EVM0012157 [Colletotrichum scovillei]|uniref:uncharacterized protein n=1 Tax=Colletotrichum scovillei TaxID=1209932 RepID=UPI0015C36854|nr:uncharacterized protein HER10_EVM0012157 [Colletotrichum scovillei]KAF4781462.1 hypothetical protein HER10_EVM0012157 [Colletotrichum scovillei]